MSTVIESQFNKDTGIATTITEQGDYVIKKQTFDAEPILDSVRDLRERLEGQRWGDGKLVAQIPLPYYYKHIAGIKDKKERNMAVLKFLRENPQFVAYDKYLKR